MTTKPAPTKLATPIKTAATKIVIVHGDKGGVGKSFVSQAIVNLFLMKNQKVAVIDGDTSNPDVSRMFESATPCLLTNLRVDNGWMNLMDFVMDHLGYTILLNTPAGVDGEKMERELRSLSNYIEQKSLDVELDLWWVMNHGYDSVNLFSRALDGYGRFFERVRVVCNLHFSDGNSEAFFLWNDSPLKTKIENKNAATVFFPGLNLRVVEKLFNPENIMPFYEAMDAAIGESVGLAHSERWKLQAWIDDANKVLTPLFDFAPPEAVGIVSVA